MVTHVSPMIWYPNNLTFDLGDPVQLTWDDEFIQKHHFYICPGHKTGKNWVKTWGGGGQPIIVEPGLA